MKGILSSGIMLGVILALLFIAWSFARPKLGLGGA